jgi:hypothetical protein
MIYRYVQKRNVHQSNIFIYAKSKNDGKEGQLIQQSGSLVILVCTKRYGTLTILPGDPELSHVCPRFLSARGAYHSCLLLHTR